jgi:hypothetical protein
MNKILLVLIFCGLLVTVKSQYFHETLDLYSNLRSSLSKSESLKLGLKSYSFLNYKGTLPNLFDNFNLSGRVRFNQAKRKFLKNTEWGIGFHAFMTGGAKIPKIVDSSPMHVKVYDNTKGTGSMYIPGLQIIRTWWFNDTTWSRIQAGVSLRYNHITNDDLYATNYPIGFEFSFFAKIRVISIQLLHADHTVYNSLTYNSEDLGIPPEDGHTRVSVPDDFRNLTTLTLAFGDDYLARPTKEENTLYYAYFTLRRNDFSAKEKRKEFDFVNLDYIFGTRITHKFLTINAELTVNKEYAHEDELYHCQIYSLLAGYDQNKIGIRAGFSHFYCFPLAVDHAALQADNVQFNKLLLAVEYHF